MSSEPDHDVYISLYRITSPPHTHTQPAFLSAHGALMDLMPRLSHSTPEMASCSILANGSISTQWIAVLGPGTRLEAGR